METMEKKPFKNKRSIKEYDFQYKEKFEILSEKYEKIKDILKQVLKDFNEEKEKQQLLVTEYQNVVREVKEKDALLERMQSVSEAVIDEYSTLRVKCDLEVAAANNASKRATKYFQENQKLKRSSQHELLDSDVSVSNELSSQESSQEEDSTSELDLLNNLASELRTEIASLKVQLTKEIEKQDSLKEDFEIAKDLYEQEVKEHKLTTKKLISLEKENNVHKMASHAPENLESCDAQCATYHKEEENISIACLETSSSSHTSDENIKLAEEQIENLKLQNKSLTTRIQELEFENRKLRAEASASSILPIPPPPPPPPLPPPSFNPIKSLITFIHAGKKSAKIKKENSETPHQKAMSEMIDCIKKGQVQLKPTPKPLPQSVVKEESALGEMKSILSTLKKKDTLSKEGTEDSASRAVLESTKHIDKYLSQACDSFNISADVDDELKLLLRKRSLKSIPSQSLCAIQLDDIKSDSSIDTINTGQPECHISALNDSAISCENNSDDSIQNLCTVPLDEIKSDCPNDILDSCLPECHISSENNNNCPNLCTVPLDEIKSDCANDILDSRLPECHISSENNNNCPTSPDNIKPGNSNNTLNTSQPESNISTLKDSVITCENNDYPIQSKEEGHFCLEFDSDNNENQNLNSIQVSENFEVKL